MQKIVIAYTPVIHRGYLDYLASTGAQIVYVVEASDVPEFPHLIREMRALSVNELTTALAAFDYEVKPFSELLAVGVPYDKKIFMPEDDVTRKLKEKYFPEYDVEFGSAFLRWDWSKATSANGAVQPSADRVIRKGDSEFAFASACMQMLLLEAKKSSDWWRQVASYALTRCGKCIVAYNKHYPHEHSPYMDGDPRDSFKPGEYIEVSSALHSEAAVIAEAAKRGISLEGAELYVTTFPCSGCASQVAAAGFSKVFFSGGYSNLNGLKILKDYEIELVYVEL